MLNVIAADMNASDPESLRDALRQLIDSIELSPESFEAVLTYRVGPASKSGDLMASPRDRTRVTAVKERQLSRPQLRKSEIIIAGRDIEVYACPLPFSLDTYAPLTHKKAI
jgi:hypothetical protein